MNNIFTKSQWLESPLAYWTIQYDYKRMGTDMLYKFYWKVWLNYSTSWFYDGLQLQLFINGNQNNITVKGYNENQKGWSYEGETDWYTVTNKTSGTTPFYAKLYDTSAKHTNTTSSTYQLAVSGASSVLGTIENFDIDNGVTIPITKYDTAYTDTLTIKLFNEDIKTVSGITNGAKVVFTEAERTRIYEMLNKWNTGQFGFVLTTTYGSTELGTSKQYPYGTISNANPIFDSGYFTYEDVNPDTFNITKNQRMIVQGKSILAVQYVEANAQKGAYMSKYIFELNGVKKEGAVEEGYIEFGVVNSANNLTLTVTAIDSRGNQTIATQEVRVVAWQEPSAVVELSRLNNYEDETHLKIKGNISSVNGINEMTIIYQYKQVGGDYGAEIPIESNTDTEITCDKNNAYVFYVRVEDTFGGKFENEYSLSKGVFPLFIDTEKNAVGINDFPAENEALRVSGGFGRFNDGIVLCGTTKKFVITVNDSGVLNITELK